MPQNLRSTAYIYLHDTLNLPNVSADKNAGGLRVQLGLIAAANRATRGIRRLELPDFVQLAFNPHRISCSLLRERIRVRETIRLPCGSRIRVTCCTTSLRVRDDFYFAQSNSFLIAIIINNRSRDQSIFARSKTLSKSIQDAKLYGPSIISDKKFGQNFIHHVCNVKRTL